MLKHGRAPIAAVILLGCVTLSGQTPRIPGCQCKHSEPPTSPRVIADTKLDAPISFAYFSHTDQSAGGNDIWCYSRRVRNNGDQSLRILWPEAHYENRFMPPNSESPDDHADGLPHWTTVDSHISYGWENKPTVDTKLYTIPNASPQKASAPSPGNSRPGIQVVPVSATITRDVQIESDERYRVSLNLTSTVSDLSARGGQYKYKLENSGNVRVRVEWVYAGDPKTDPLAKVIAEKSPCSTESLNAGGVATVERPEAGVPNVLAGELRIFVTNKKGKEQQVAIGFAPILAGLSKQVKMEKN